MTPAQLAAIKSRFSGYTNHENCTCICDGAALIAEVERLRAVLRKYGQHTRVCNQRNCSMVLGCVCGLDEALR